MKDWKAECEALKRIIRNKDNRIQDLESAAESRGYRDSQFRDTFRELIIDLLGQGR